MLVTILVAEKDIESLAEDSMGKYIAQKEATAILNGLIMSGKLKHRSHQRYTAEIYGSLERGLSDEQGSIVQVVLEGKKYTILIDNPDN